MSNLQKAGLNVNRGYHGMYTHHPTFVTATSGVLTRLPAKLSKNGMRVQTSADWRSRIKLRI